VESVWLYHSSFSRIDSHLSHIEVSQQGSFTAFTATRLHRPQRSLAGISSGRRVLGKLASVHLCESSIHVRSEIELVLVEFGGHDGGGVSGVSSVGLYAGALSVRGDALA